MAASLSGARATAPTRPLPPPPPSPTPSQLSAPRPSFSSSINTTDSDKLNVPSPQHSIRKSKSNSNTSTTRTSSFQPPMPSVAVLGPPPSLPLPDLPPFPSPVAHQMLNLNMSTSSSRSNDAQSGSRRPSLPRRVSDFALSASTSSIPSSPTMMSSDRDQLTPHVSRRVASSASLGRLRTTARPLSSASLFSVASGNSHISAASEALGQSMLELDREAEELGILLPPSSPRPGSEFGVRSRSLGSSSKKSKIKRSSSRPSLPPSQPTPLSLPPSTAESPTWTSNLQSLSSSASFPSLSTQPPSMPLPSPPLFPPYQFSAPPTLAEARAQTISLNRSTSTPLLASTLRKASLRSLYASAGLSSNLPSPSEEAELEHDARMKEINDIIGRDNESASTSTEMTKKKSSTSSPPPSALRRPSVATSVSRSTRSSSTTSSFSSERGSGSQPPSSFASPSTSSHMLQQQWSSSSSANTSRFSLSSSHNGGSSIPPVSGSGRTSRTSRSTLAHLSTGESSTSSSSTVPASPAPRVTEAARARAAAQGRASPTVTDMLDATPRPALRNKGSNSSFGAKSRKSGGGGDRSSRARTSSTGSNGSKPRAASGTRSKSRSRAEATEANCDAVGNETIATTKLRGSASLGAINTTLTTLSGPVRVPPVPPPSSFLRNRTQLSRRANEEAAAITVVSPTESQGDDVWMTPDSGGEQEAELELMGMGSDSESSIDLHTPLPQILVRDGVLSPTSTVIRSLAESVDAKHDADGPTASKRKDAPQIDVRKRRHRDGRLLREGVGLTTGLGWSDSEDENTPGPMRRRLSRLLLRRVDNENESLAPVASAGPAPEISPTLSSPSPIPSPTPLTKPLALRKANSAATLTSSNPSPSAPQLPEDRMSSSSSPVTQASPRSILSSNPSLDAKVKALLKRAEAYKKETLVRKTLMQQVVPGATSSSHSSSRSSSSKEVTPAATPSPPPLSPPIEENVTIKPVSTRPHHATSLSRSSLSSLKKSPTVIEEAEEEAFSAAEAAYRQSKEISNYRYSTVSSGSMRTKVTAASRALSSSTGSRESMYSTASSSGITEFGVRRSSETSVPATPSGAMLRSAMRARAATSGTTAPSAFHFPPGASAPPVTTTQPPLVPPKYPSSASLNASPSNSTISSNLSSGSPLSSFTSSPSISTAPSSARQSLVAADASPISANGDDKDDSMSRIAKLSNASTTSVSSATHSLAPSLFSINSTTSTDTSFMSDGAALLTHVNTSAGVLAGGKESFNVIPPTPTKDESPHGKSSTFVSQMRAPRRQLPHRPSIQPVVSVSSRDYTSSGDERRTTSSSTMSSQASNATVTTKPRKSSLSSSIVPSTSSIQRKISTPTPLNVAQFSAALAASSTPSVPDIPTTPSSIRHRATSIPRISTSSSGSR